MTATTKIPQSKSKDKMVNWEKHSQFISQAKSSPH